MTPADLRALADAATPGPWKACGASEGRCQCGQVWSTSQDGVVAITRHPTKDEDRLDDVVWGPDDHWRDAAFIAACRTAVPALLDENAALRARCEQLEEELRQDATADLVAMGVDVDAERARFTSTLDHLEEIARLRAKVLELAGLRYNVDIITLREERDTALARAEKAEADRAHWYGEAKQAQEWKARAEKAERERDELQAFKDTWGSVNTNLHDDAGRLAYERDEARRERDALVRGFVRLRPGLPACGSLGRGLWDALSGDGPDLPALLAALGEKA